MYSFYKFGKTFCLLICLLPMLLSCSSQQRGFVWRFSKDSKNIYVFGVTHITLAKHATLPSYVKKIYENSTAIGVESITTPELEAQARGETSGNRKLPPKTTSNSQVNDILSRMVAKKYLTQEQAEDLQNSTSFEFIDVLPIMLRNSSDMQSNAIQKKLEWGWDMQLHTLNKSENKPLLQLETAELAKYLWNKNCGDAQIKIDMLNNSISAFESPKYSEETLEKLVELLSAGDEVKFKSEFDQIRSKYPIINFVHQCGFTDRQHHWVRALNSHLTRQQGDILFAVGIGHLFVQPTLIELAKADGFTVHRVFPDGRLELR